MTATPKIMVVNDDDLQRAIIAGVLKKENWSVLEYSKASDALADITAHGAPGLIVTDLYMPEIDGWRFCRLLRSAFYPSTNQTPILVVSATYAGDHARDITVEMGANAFQPAPINPLALIANVRALMAGETIAHTSSVLIIEDDPITAKMLSRIFSGAGYAVRIALTDADGRRMFHEQPPEVVTLDYHLPGIKGDVLLKEFKGAYPSAVVIMLTSDISPELATRFMSLGADAYVHKPFDAEYLMTLCERCRRARALLRVEELLEARSVELRKSEARFRGLFEKMLDGLAICEVAVDAQGQPQDFYVLQVNPAFERLTGLKAPEVNGKTLRRILQPIKPELIEPLIATAMTGKPTTYEFFAPAAQRHCEGIAYCPEPGQLALIVADVTERKRAMDLRLQSSRIEATATLASGVAHRFNNLMTATLGNAQLLTDYVGDSPRAREMLEAIVISARKAGELAHTLLAYARGGKYYITDTNMNDVVQEFANQAAQSLPIQVKFDVRLASDLWQIKADAKQMSQIVSNLCLNAIEAVGDAGAIIVATHNEVIGQLRHGSHSDIPPGRFAVLSVSDTGPGMDEQTAKRIFEPFFSTKFLGRGLGLAAVYGIVKNHGGYFDVNTAPGQGSVFTIYLSAKEERTEPAAAQKADMEPGARTILVIEDEDAVARILHQTLEKLGYHTLQAGNGLQAVEVARSYTGNIHGALLDLAMPVMDGFDAFPLLREARPNMKILLTSGYDINPAAHTLLQKGACVFLRKPFTMETLAAELKSAFSGR